MPMAKKCQYCYSELTRDEIGLAKKLFEPDTRRGKFVCLTCMSEMLETSVDDLEDKIQELKRQGCKLFR